MLYDRTYSARPVVQAAEDLPVMDPHRAMDGVLRRWPATGTSV